MEENKKVGIWIRVSTEDQAKGESPEHHEKRARYFAESKEWQVVTVYNLEAVSGKSVMDHPEAKRMLRDIKQGAITGLIFSKLARLARNTRELLDFADYFREYDADLISLQESIDTSSAAGRLFYTMIAAMAQWEREEIAGRVADSVPIRAKLGKPLGGAASFGYKWLRSPNGQTLILDENEAPIRKLMYELFLKYKRKKTTAEELNKQGFRTRDGGKFTDTTIDRLLRDPSAKGQRRTNYTKSLGAGKKWEIKPESEWVISECPAIVSEDVWDECNRILEEQSGSRKKRGPRTLHLLAGFVTCDCGNKMYIYHNSPIYNCRQCKRKIEASILDEVFHEQLKEFLFTEKDVKDYLNKSDEVITEKRQLLENLSKQVKKLKERMDELVGMRTGKELSPDDFKLHYAPLQEQYSQLEQQLPEIEAEIDFLKIQALSSDVVIEEAHNLYKQWTKMEHEEKRNIIELILESIIVGKDEISLSLAYQPERDPSKRAQINTLTNISFGFLPSREIPEKGNTSMSLRIL